MNGSAALGKMANTPAPTFSLSYARAPMRTEQSPTALTTIG